VKELLVRARLGWGQPPTGWPPPHHPRRAPPVVPGPNPLHPARSLGRWLWPTLAVSGFLAVVVQILDHDSSAPGLSYRGLLTVALAAVVVVLLTIHRRNGPRPLTRALAEYAAVALLATLLTAPGVGIKQQPANHPASGQARAQAAPGDDQPAVLRAVTKVLRAGAAVVRGVTNTARWLINLWHRADQQATAKGQSMAAPAPPRSPSLSAPPTWRSHA
jgi:hypothetical protein